MDAASGEIEGRDVSALWLLGLEAQRTEEEVRRCTRCMAIEFFFYISLRTAVSRPPYIRRHILHHPWIISF